MTCLHSHIIVVRLDWVHARAALYRWNEEVHLLKEESRRIVESFQFEEEQWLAKKEEVVGGGAARASRGRMAFINRQAWVYSQLAERALKHYEEVCAG